MGYDVLIQSLDQAAFIDVRGEFSDMQIVLDELRLKIPKYLGEIIASNGVDVMRVGRNRLLIRTEISNESVLFQKLAAHTREILVQCTCVSDMYSGISLVGGDCHQVLAQLTPLDFSNLKPGTIQFTEIYRLAGFIIFELDSSHKVYVERSYFHYVTRRLSQYATIDLSAKTVRHENIQP